MPEDYKLIVLHKLEDSFGLYKVSTGEMLRTIGTGSFPHEICLDPARKNLYIAEMGVRGIESEGPGGHTISVFDIRNLERINYIDTGIYDRPHGIVTSGTRLYVTSESTMHLLLYDLKTRHLVKALFLGQECAHMVGVTGDGKSVYTANIRSNSITGVDTSDFKIIHHISVPERPEGMVFSPDDKLIYCVCREAECVVVIDRSKAEIKGKITTGSGPVRIAISNDGKKLCIPIFHSAAVQFADTASGMIRTTLMVGPHPAGVCLSPSGDLAFISCEEENMIYVIDFKNERIISTIKTGDGADAMVCIRGNETEIN